MWKLINKALNYAWGSTHAIPGYLGDPPSDEPVAELWVGTHPIAPSTVADGTELSHIIASDKEAMLGRRVSDTFGELPFLVKLLAADAPLSLQVHPKLDAARAGFARENEAGICLTDRTRTYKDPHAKPEILLALTDTTTLVGFRQPHDTLALLELLGGQWAEKLADLVRPGTCMINALDYVTTQDVWDEARDYVLSRAAELAEHEPFRLVTYLDSYFPGDPGAAAPLIMNVATYGPGQVLYTGDAVIHAHVKGFGIEVMTSSDNVIRAGLTTKYIDREALLENVDSVPGPPTFLEPTGPFNAFIPPVAEFAAVICHPGSPCPDNGPRIALALEDNTTIAGTDTITLRRGETVFIPDHEGTLTVTSGSILLAFVP